MLKFLHDILPNEAEYEYFLTYLSQALYGNTLELFTILTGIGRNGKSKLIELIKITFGKYYAAISSQLLTRPRPDADKPDPGLLNILKKRIVIASEPEKNCKLNTGFLKFITGRDTTSLRNCHSNEIIDFAPKFLTFLICNDIPDCDDIDNAFSKRLRCINFPTEFVDDPVTSKQKKIDTKINEKFNNWKNDFILLLINYYKKYNEVKKLVATDKILKWTNKYKEDTDIYLTFLNERTIKSEKNLHTADLYNDFKEWYGESNPGVKKPTNREFKIGIEKHEKIKKVKYNGKSQLGIKNLSIIKNTEDKELIVKKYISSNCKEGDKIPLETFILSCIKFDPSLQYNYIKCYVEKKYTIYSECGIIFIKNINNNNEMSNGEKIINNFLVQKNIKFEYQKYFKECADKTYLPFDFYIPDINICIEYDGEQHYKPVNIFGGIEAFNIIKIHDKIKNKFCKTKNVNLIRIKYDKTEEDIINMLSNLFNKK